MQTHVILIFLNLLLSTGIGSKEAHFLSAVSRGSVLAVGVDCISERDVRLVQATPSSVLDGCLDGWDEGGLQ